MMHHNYRLPSIVASHDKFFLVPIGAVMGVTTDILDTCCSEPEWLITNEALLRFVEFLLWDTFREGISSHLAGSTPCLFPDTDKLIALVRKALGK